VIGPKVLQFVVLHVRPRNSIRIFIHICIFYCMVVSSFDNPPDRLASTRPRSNSGNSNAPCAVNTSCKIISNCFPAWFVVMYFFLSTFEPLIPPPSPGLDKTVERAKQNHEKYDGFL
jgi:hypothetical protein